MARPRLFDSEQTENCLLEVFWENGYEATSIDGLCSAAGLSKSSLYSSFGDKQQIFLNSLKRYIKVRIGHIREIFDCAENFESALATLLLEIIQDVENGPGTRGCFIGNCVADISILEKEPANLVRVGMAEMEAIFFEALLRHRKLSDDASQQKYRKASRYLFASLQGLRLVAKARPDRSVLEDIAQVINQSVQQIIVEPNK
jgi:TetR/AcrR family transcriptional repressor of nem operon